MNRFLIIALIVVLLGLAGMYGWNLLEQYSFTKMHFFPE